uniref:Secreted protein n=1 Tax=Cacopsylla melanoneura TaxID=428564 RepID=A0A8D8LUU3_9HEMI
MAVLSALSFVIASFLLFTSFSDVSGDGADRTVDVKTKTVSMVSELCVQGHVTACGAVGVEFAKDVCVNGASPPSYKDWGKKNNVGTANFTKVTGQHCIATVCSAGVEMSVAPFSASLECFSTENTKPGYKLGDTECTCTIIERNATPVPTGASTPVN